ncbi:MAG: site-2 protease family protein [Clostridiaceae bacterium]|jgi:regulator of sigma E protease|nr:site-2 protease family protein [Clostridiaceae bacterium]
MSFIISATFASVMTNIGYIIVAIIGLMIMIVIHELGHYLAGKALGFKIDEFAIGFGPRIFKHTSKKTGEIFSIRPLPLGGFCAFHGEDDDINDPGAFNNQKPWKRLIVQAAGAVFNFLSGIFIITLFFSIYGQPLPVIVAIHEDGAAYAENTFQFGDAVLSIDGKLTQILMPEDVAAAFAKAGDTARFKVLRHTFDADGNITSAKVVEFTAHKSDFSFEKIIYDEDGVTEIGRETQTAYGFGISQGLAYVKLPFFKALGRSFPYAFFLVFKILAMLGALVTGKTALSGAGGTITAVRTVAEVSKVGFHGFMWALCILSANLAVMNLLPFPALDGSRMVFTLIEMIFKKPVPRKVEAAIHTVGLVVLILLVVFLDVFNLVSSA